MDFSLVLAIGYLYKGEKCNGDEDKFFMKNADIFKITSAL